MRIENSFIQIPGVGERTEQCLWNHGVVDWRGGIDTTVIGPSRRRKINEFALAATEELDDGNVPYFAKRLPSSERWRLGESFRDRVTALDIETTGLDSKRDRVTTVSFHGPSGTRTLVRGRDLTPARLTDELRSMDLLVTFNGARFDLPFLIDDLGVTIETPHLDLMYPCRRLGWHGGLKSVERQLGIERAVPDVDGREAVRLWYRHREGDSDALDRLIRYNREDVRTLLPLVDAVISELDQTVYRPYIPD